jgi:hypothetical protein
VRPDLYDDGVYFSLPQRLEGPADLTQKIQKITKIAKTRRIFE